MKKTLVQIYTEGQKLEYRSRPTIASSGVNEDVVEFSIDEIWDGLTLYMVAYREDNPVVYTTPLDEGFRAVIPWEVIAHEGTIYIGLCGEDDSGKTVVTSDLLPYKITKGLSASDLVSDPTENHRGIVKTAWLADGAVTSPKVADEAIEEKHLSNELKSQLGKGITYELVAGEDDQIVLRGSDGSETSVTVKGGAPEADADVINDILGGME